MSGFVPELLMIPECVSGLGCIKLGDSEQEQMCKWDGRRQRKAVGYTRCSGKEKHRSEMNVASVLFYVKVIFKKSNRRLTSQQRLNNAA